MSAYVSENGDQIIATFSEEIGPTPLLREISELVDVDLGLLYAAVMTVWDDGFDKRFLVLVRFGDLSWTQLPLSRQHDLHRYEREARIQQRLRTGCPGPVPGRRRQRAAAFPVPGCNEHLNR